MGKSHSGLGNMETSQGSISAKDMLETERVMEDGKEKEATAVRILATSQPLATIRKASRRTRQVSA